MDDTTKKTIIFDHAHGLAKILIGGLVCYAVNQLVGKGYDAALQSYRSKHTEK